MLEILKAYALHESEPYSQTSAIDSRNKHYRVPQHKINLAM